MWIGVSSSRECDEIHAFVVRRRVVGGEGERNIRRIVVVAVVGRGNNNRKIPLEWTMAMTVLGLW